VVPYYSDEWTTVYCGDARDVLPRLNLTDCVLLTDPVYGVDGGRGGDARRYGKARYDAHGWTDDEEYVRSVCVPVVEHVLRYAKRGAVTPGIRCLSFYPRPADMGCFWTPAGVTTGPWGLGTMQPILYYGRDYRAGKGAWPTGRQVNSISEQNGHPCPKPITGWRWLAAKMAEAGDVLVDPFLGSGTTIRAAKDLGLRSIGIEIEERYCDIAVGRLAQLVLPF